MKLKSLPKKFVRRVNNAYTEMMLNINRSWVAVNLAMLKGK